MKELLNWEVGYCNFPDNPPLQYFPATVPGAVQLDFKNPMNLPDYLFGTNFEEYRWMEDKYFLYRSFISPAHAQNGNHVFFVSKGIDYQFDIFLNGNLLHHQEGMYTPVCLDITSLLLQQTEDSLLEILIYPVPKLPSVPEGRQEASQCTKPPASYSWDWHPRLIPSGIWQDTYLLIRPCNTVFEAEASYQLSDDFAYATISFSANIGDNETVLWSLYNPASELIFTSVKENCSFTIKNPQLWWCNGMGDPARYRWVAEAQSHIGTQEKTGHIGFRKVSLEMNHGTWDEPEAFPKSRSRAPITIVLNNQPIFCKGSNWVMPEIFYGATTKELYETEISLAKEANFNMLRCWGGANINKDCFFDLCDQYGIMVWQEFPLACNNYIGTPQYLKILEQEATSILLNLRSHPSVVLWCGGNELFNNWSGMTDQSLALRLLNKLCYELDRDTPFIPTSPIDGMAHGCYLFVYPDGREVYQAMNESHFTAYTEFGVPSIANKETLLMATSIEELFPLQKTKNTIAHHAFDAWFPGDTWSSIDTLQQYFGSLKSLDDMIDKSQWMQSEGYKCIYEEARRQKPYCSMALNWCYNEPWPCIANNSLLSYPALPKAAYYAVQNACRPVLLSAKLQRFSYAPQDLFEVELWLLNDSPDMVPATTAEIYLQIGEHSISLLSWNIPKISAGKNLQGPTVRTVLPDINIQEFTLHLECSSLSSTYTLCFHPSATHFTQNTPILNM